MSLSHFFIYNPHCGNSRTREVARRIQNAVAMRFPWRETSGPNDAERLAQEAASSGAKIVVACGGDGTVHEVMNGLMRSDRPFRPAVGIVPLGNGNDFGYAAGIPSDPIDALDLALRGRGRSVDIGSIQHRSREKRYWINSCGIGLNAQVAIRARSIRRWNGVAKYLAASILSIWEHSQPCEIEIGLDTHSIVDRAMLLTLGNGPREGGGFLMVPNARIDDGHFDLLVVKQLSRMKLFLLLPKARRGKHLASPAVSVHPFVSATFHCSTPLAIHTDGEIFARPEDGISDVSVELHPAALQIIY